jgi:hypothetical protein
MSSPSPVPNQKTIDDVLHEKDEKIANCIDTNDRRGYFCGLYRHVTLAVKKGIEDSTPGKDTPPTFDNPERMGRFDVTFAYRYLDAYNDYDAGKADEISDCWRFTFDEAKNDDYAIMQHMMVGMFSHICLDLGVAVAENSVEEAANNHTTAGKEFALFKGDYDTINGLLADLVPIMDCKLDLISPTYKNLSIVVENRWPHLVMAAMIVARELAWNYARRHVLLHDEKREEAVTQARDQLTYLLNKELFRLGPVFNHMERREERGGRTVGDIVTIIANTEDACAKGYQHTALRNALARKAPSS